MTCEAFCCQTDAVFRKRRAHKVRRASGQQNCKLERQCRGFTGKNKKPLPHRFQWKRSPGLFTPARRKRRNQPSQLRSSLTWPGSQQSLLGLGCRPYCWPRTSKGPGAPLDLAECGKKQTSHNYGTYLSKCRTWQSVSAHILRRLLVLTAA